MSENLDRRARKSRQAIFRAFEVLLGKKSYSSITVGDIIEEADIGRSTFYAHFSTKDDLLDELCGDIFRHVLAPSPEKEHSFAASPEEQLAHILHHLREQQSRLAPLFKSPSSALFWDALRSQVNRYFTEAVGNTIQRRGGVPDDAYALFLAASLVELVRWWFGTAPRLAPESVLAMYLNVTSVRFAT